MLMSMVKSVTETLTEQKMNFEEIQELKRGDLVRDRVTGAVFKVYQVECYPDELNEDRYVSIPLRIGLENLPEGVEYIRTGSADDEVFKMVGDHDWIYYDIESYYHATVMHANERILTCEDLEPTTMVKLLKPENVASFKNEDLIKKVEEAARAELAENLIFPVEEARANKEKFFTLRREFLQISQLIEEASAQGKSCVRIPSDLDRIEITALFLKAGYRVGNSSIAW